MSARASKRAKKRLLERIKRWEAIPASKRGGYNALDR